MAQLTLTCGMDRRNRVLCCPDTELKTIVLEVFRLVEYDASICEHVEKALDAAALESKRERLAVSAEEISGTTVFEQLSVPSARDVRSTPAEQFVLQSGRPRSLDGESVLVLCMCRAHLGSLSSGQAIDRIRDSVAVRAYFGETGLPSRSTMHAWVNRIPEECFGHILDAHLLMVRSEGLDSMDAVTADSFSVWANTSWPTDSAMILGLLSRAWHFAAKLPGLGLEGFSQAYIPLWLKRIGQLDREISFACGKPNSRRKIRRLYARLCTRAELLLTRLHRQLPQLRPCWEQSIESLPFPTARRAEAALARINSDLADAARVVDYARSRVLEDRSIPSTEKILSLSDPSASYIKKGGREPVIGYKPQVMRSRHGFITAFEVQKGNPSDAARLVPLAEQHLDRTNAPLSEISVDDGYSSGANRRTLAGMGVEVISMNGSKGRQITPEEEWDSLPYEQARNGRSAVESLVFTLRAKFHLHRFSRRGIDAVRIEMYEKVIAHNFWRAALLRERAAARERGANSEAA